MYLMNSESVIQHCEPTDLAFFQAAFRGKDTLWGQLMTNDKTVCVCIYVFSMTGSGGIRMYEDIFSLDPQHEFSKVPAVPTKKYERVMKFH